MNQIKVNTYTIQVRDKNRKRIKTSEETKTKYLKFGNILNVDGKNYNFIDVFRKFIKTFDTEFLGLTSSTKAMRLTDNLSINSSEEIISGFFKAGFTGEQKEIYEKTAKDDKSIFTVKSEHVNCSSYFFILWLPSEYSTGLLMIQGTSVESAGYLFQRLFHIFLNKELEDKFVKISRFTSKKTIEDFKKNSKVQRIVLSKNSYPKDVANDILGQEILSSNVRMKLIIEGDFIDGKVLDFVNKKLGTSFGDQPKFFTSDTLEDLHFGKEDDYETDISFRDKGSSKSAVAKSRSGFEIKPFTYIDESEIERDELTHIPTEESIKKAIETYFFKIKDEIL